MLTFNEKIKLEAFAERCEKVLLSTEPIPFVFPESCSSDHWPDDEIKKLNENLLSTLIHRANVYAVFVRESQVDSQWVNMYVGQCKSKLFRQRVTEHLV